MKNQVTNPIRFRARLPFIANVLVVLSTLVFVSSAHAIKKCQDDDGKWHYGDVAVHECESSKVTTLSDRGFIESELDAPKTDEEIAAEKEQLAAIEAEKNRIQHERNERNRILSVYQSEADIDRQLENQIYSVESNIAVHNVFLKSMSAKIDRLETRKAEVKERFRPGIQSQIDEANLSVEEKKKELVALKEQKEQIKERFQREKELYRSLKEEASS